jgi:fibro-slime domain-containing protein
MIIPRPFPRSAYFNAELARNGLIGYYYQGIETTAQSPNLIQHDLFIFPNDLLQEPFTIVWKGRIEIPKTGEYIFSTYSDDGSYVYIDNQLIVDNGGSHGGEKRQGSVTLNQGLHDLEIHYWQVSGGSEMQFWWQPPGELESIVPLEYLFPVDVSGMENP